MREIGAMLRAQWRIALTYRTRMVLSLFSVLIGVIPVFFVAQAVQPLLAGALVDQGGQLFSFIVVGTIAMLFLTSAIGTMPGAVGSGISTGIWEAMLATPARPWGLLAWFTAYDLVWTLARSIALLVAAWALGARIAWGGAALSLGVLLLIVLAYLPVGILSAALVLALRTTTPLPRVVVIASVFLGGVYYPTSVIPSWIQRLSDWIPLTYGLRALRRALLEGWSLRQILPDVEMLVLFDAVLLLVSVSAFAVALRYARRAGTLAQY